MNVTGGYELLGVFLLAWTAKATVLLGVAWIVTFLVRWQSAALRHRVWAIAIISSLALPAAMLAIPAWHVISARSTVAQSASETVVVTNLAELPTSPQQTVRQFDADMLMGAALVLWALGTMLIALRLMAGVARLWRIGAYAKWAPENACAAVEELRAAFGVARKVRLLEAASANAMPMAWGIFRPRIVLPRDAAEWAEERRRIVLSHELAHVRRHDWPLQLCAEVLRACLWFHPLAWIAANRMRQESERACDDAVLNSGIGAPEYASQLLALAQTLHAPAWRFSLALAIARPSNLERRFAAMLNSSISRSPLSRRASLSAVLLGAGLLLPLAALTLSAKPSPVIVQSSLSTPSAAAPAENSAATPGAVITGTVVDQRGLPIPKLNVTSIRGEISNTTATDAEGKFLFSDLAPGVYTVRIERRRLGITQSKTIDVVLRSRTSTANVRLALTGATGVPPAVPVSPREPSPVPDGSEQNANVAPGSIEGTVLDPSGAVVVGATVDLTFEPGTPSGETTTGPIGTFSFPALVPGDYTITVRQPGFQIFAEPNVHLFAGQRMVVNTIRLSVGKVTQVVTVSTSRGSAGISVATPSAAAPFQGCSANSAPGVQPQSNAAAPAATPTAPTRIRVGGMVEAARLTHQTLPIYPDAARAAGIQGTVVMNAIIGKDGTLLSACVASGPSELVQSAIDAVSEWRYTPTLLNGEPVEVETQIAVEFTLKN